MENSATRTWPIKKVNAEKPVDAFEFLAVEEPLEIILVYSTTNGRAKKNISVTMRTPGADEDLAIGFLFAEGIINEVAQVNTIQHNRLDANQVIVTLHENEMPVLENISRNFFSSSACGICGKTSTSGIRGNIVSTPMMDSISIAAKLLYQFPSKLFESQEYFSSTGGLHAAAIADQLGNICLLREDIGRHNAVDKVIGSALKTPVLQLENSILLLSGRAGFELVQKAARARVPVIASIGAPSSMAVDMAGEYGITLIGFLRQERFNIYCGAHRIIME